MRIQHNISALNAYRQLGNNNSSVSKNLEKLSSGYRINRAGDDAAGLAISEKMRAQIKGLETAQKNANDGISLVQTAEGALTEVHSMLNRMVELATQSANGTYDDTTDRVNLQKEIVSLQDEINRISEGTNFNGINLLDGSMGLNKDVFTAESFKLAATNGAEIGSIGNKAGTNAVRPGSGAASAAKAEFSIDLSDLKITSSSASGSSSVAVNITVGTASFSVTVSADSAGSATAGAIASAFATGNSSVAIGGITFNVTASGNYIKFEQASNPSSTTQMSTGEFGVSVSVATTGTDGSDISVTGDYLDQTAFVTPSKMASSGGLAEIDLKLDLNAIKDGSSLKVGGTKYIFDLKGGDTITAGAGEKVVDLTNIDIDDLTIEDVVDRLTQANSANIANDTWVIGKGDGANEGYITLRQKAGSTAITTVDGVKAEIEFSKAASKNAGSKLTIKDATKLKEGMSISVGNKTYEFVKTGGSASIKGAIAVEITGIENGMATNADVASQLKSKIDANDTSVSAELNSAGDGLNIYTTKTGGSAPEISGGGLTLQVGDTNDSFQKVTVKVGSMNTTALGIGNIDISTQQGASDAIGKIKDAINKVSSTRGDLGAIQNRLDHTINNLGVTTENMTAAESRIRDVDMAKEMMDFTKNNILVQASQAMLAQANQLPQGVLQLLQ